MTDFMWHRARMQHLKPKAISGGALRGSNMSAVNHPSTKRATSSTNRPPKHSNRVPKQREPTQESDSVLNQKKDLPQKKANAVGKDVQFLPRRGVTPMEQETEFRKPLKKYKNRRSKLKQ